MYKRQAPIRLLTNEPQVEANAIVIINGMPETLRMILVMASARSPRCSTTRKNIKQVDMDGRFCIIVQKDTPNIAFSVLD